MDVHVLPDDTTAPLLMSQFAQSKLGLVKDRCYIRKDGEELTVPLARAKGSHLLCINLSSGLRQKTELPRAIRKLRTSQAVLTTTYAATTEVERVGDFCSLCWAQLLCAGCGVLGKPDCAQRAVILAKACFPDHRITDDTPIYVMDALKLHDPEGRPQTRGHIGRHPDTLEAPLRAESFLANMRELKQKLDQSSEERPRRCYVLFVCNQARHRSVAACELVDAIRLSLPMDRECRWYTLVSGIPGIRCAHVGDGGPFAPGRVRARYIRWIALLSRPVDGFRERVVWLPMMRGSLVNGPVRAL